MIELVDTLPDVNLQAAEYQRLLGYPRDVVLTGRALELADGSRTWYRKNGRPWVYARHAETLQIDHRSISIDGAPFHCSRLQHTLSQADAHGAVLVAVSAGAELETEAQRLWREEKPDEYFFLEIFGSAVVEHLVTTVGSRLCAWADRNEMAVLPHYSPGYPEWDVAEQPRLLKLLRASRNQSILGQIEVLESGMLRPKKSLLAVFGLTRHTDRVRRLTDLLPCENCSMPNCQYRRVPYLRAPDYSNSEVPPAIDEPLAEFGPFPSSNGGAKYSINTKALNRWADERLTLQFNADGSIDAAFRYDGTTCTNMGRPLAFLYHVKLGPRRENFPIREQRCGPAPGDTGHKYMCRYMNNAEHLMVAIDHEKPLLGRPLHEALSWDRPNDPAGCYCEPSSRKHKWGLVLETIHFALAQNDIGQ